MPTDKIFWRDPYLTRLDTRVATVAGPAVTLDETIFFAFSGGQESDRGSIGPWPVVEARVDGAEIVYTLPPEHGLTVGAPVGVEIDWQRRYRLMRHHFAAELVLELAYRHFDEIDKIGAHIAADKARIDFAWPSNLASELPVLADRAQAIVDNDLPIVSAFSDAARGERYWQIDGFARVPCGGTHPRSTAEVGTITLRRKNIGAGKERIEVTLSE